MSHKHAHLMRSIFQDPPSANIHWREIESLLHHLGAEVGWRRGLPGAGPRGDPPIRHVTDTPAPDTEQSQTGFLVRLKNFEGPFDLLLQLIFAHRLDVTDMIILRRLAELVRQRMRDAGLDRRVG